MKKGKKGILALGLVLSALCSSVNAGAYNNAGIAESRLRCDVKRSVNSEMIMLACTTIDIKGRTAALTANVTCNLDVESIDVELILQIYAESAWPQITSWKHTENSSILLIDREYTKLSCSGTYRAKCVITAHKGSKEEKIPIYSGERKYVHKP